MKSSPFLLLIAAAAAGLGIATLLVALFLDDVSPLLRMSSLLVAGTLIVGAGMLVARRSIAVLLFWLSALTYFLSIVWPAFNRYGIAAFAMLMDAFYWSLAVRIFLAIAAHAVLAHRKVATSMSIDTDEQARRSSLR